MTDPNYWLAAWLAFMVAIFIPAIFKMIIQQKVGETLFGGFIAVVNTFAALYCAGFVVVMP